MIAIQVRRYGKAVVLIVAVMVAAVVAALYILSQERLQSPFAKSYTINAAFSTVSGVAPGLGEPVNVSGVQVGQISGADLRDGQGVLHLRIDPKKLSHIYANARAVVVPNSPLKDMQVNLRPGGRPARRLKSGDTIPIGQTTSPIDSDDLLAALDTDTRAWMITLLSGLDGGTTGRAADLNTLFKALGPTAEQAREVGDVLAARRRQVSRLVHNLATLSTAAGAKDGEIATVVEAGNATLGALASQDVALRASTAQLPGTLRTLRNTLGNTTAFARELGPTLTALTPTARRLAPTLRDSRALFQGGGLLPVARVKPFVDAILPVARILPPASRALREGTPPLTEAFSVLGEFTNELAYNGGGANPGFLYWLAWFGHNFNSTFSTADANGGVVRGLALLSCSSLASEPALTPLITTLLGRTGLCSS